MIIEAMLYVAASIKTEELINKLKGELANYEKYKSDSALSGLEYVCMLITMKRLTGDSIEEASKIAKQSASVHAASRLFDLKDRDS